MALYNDYDEEVRDAQGTWLNTEHEIGLGFPWELLPSCLFLFFWPFGVLSLFMPFQMPAKGQSLSFDISQFALREGFGQSESDRPTFP